MSDQSQDGVAGQVRARKRMKIFRASEGTEFSPDHMPILGIDEIAMASYGKIMQSGVTPGTAERVTTLFAEPGEDGFSLTHAWFKSGYVLPRHSHDSDCLYFVMSGELRMGTQILRKGDGVFVPADFAYTFDAGAEGVEVLEFRNRTKFHMLLKGNDEAHWDRIAQSYTDNAEAWQSETCPPGDR